MTATGERLAPIDMNATVGWFPTAAELQHGLGGVDHLARGALISAATPATFVKGVSRIDDTLRNRLFGKKLDLLAINIQRGRDHGLPNYRNVRKAFGLSLSAARNIENQRVVQNAYGGMSQDMDVYTGMLLETPDPVVGETASAVIWEQFQRLNYPPFEQSH